MGGAPVIPHGVHLTGSLIAFGADANTGSYDFLFTVTGVDGDVFANDFGGIGAIGGLTFRPRYEEAGFVGYDVAAFTPVPEPTTYGLFAGAFLLGLTVLRRKCVARLAAP
jgi:hypothetical protein